MSDVVETKVAETVMPAQDTAVDANVLKEQLEAIKKAQAGSDKAYQEAAKRKAELEAEVEKLKKEKMTEKEKAEFEFAKQKAELEAKSREVADATLRLSKAKLMGEKNVPMEFSDFINGQSEQELTERLDTFTKLVEAEVGKRVQAKLAGSTPPAAGTQEPAQQWPDDWRSMERKFQGR